MGYHKSMSVIVWFDDRELETTMTDIETFANQITDSVEEKFYIWREEENVREFQDSTWVQRGMQFYLLSTLISCIGGFKIVFGK